MGSRWRGSISGAPPRAVPLLAKEARFGALQPTAPGSGHPMTLSPVFRSARAVQLLAEQGVWEGLAPDMEAQAEAVRTVYADLEDVIGERFRTDAPHVPTAAEVTTPEGLHFLQEYLLSYLKLLLMMQPHL